MRSIVSICEGERFVGELNTLNAKPSADQEQVAGYYRCDLACC